MILKIKKDYFFTLFLQFASIFASIIYQFLIANTFGLSSSLSDFFLVFSSFSFLHVVSATYISTVVLSNEAKLPLKYFKPTYFFLLIINTLILIYFLSLNELKVSPLHIFMMWTMFQFVFYNNYISFSKVAEKRSIYFSLLVPFLQQILNIFFFFIIRFWFFDHSILFEVNFFSTLTIFLFYYFQGLNKKEIYVSLSPTKSNRIKDLFYIFILYSPFLLAPVVINHYIYIQEIDNRNAFYYIFTIVSFLSVFISHFQSIDIFFSSMVNFKKLRNFCLITSFFIVAIYFFSFFTLDIVIQFLIKKFGFNHLKYLIFFDNIFIILMLSTFIGTANIIRSILIKFVHNSKFYILLSGLFFSCLFCGFFIFRTMGMFGVLLSYLISFGFFLILSMVYLVKRVD